MTGPSARRRGFRAAIAALPSAIFIAACTHASADPALIGRYGYGYAGFLILMAVMATKAWRIALNPESCDRLLCRAERHAWLSAAALALGLASIMGFMALVAFSSRDLPFLNLLGCVAVGPALLGLGVGSGVRPKEEGMKVALAVISCFLAFVGVEIAFRFVAYRNDQKTLEGLEHLSNRPSSGPCVPLGDVIRRSENPLIIYELKPNLSVRFEWQPLSTNEAGFRGEIVTLDKADRTLRILGLGDSIMFGWGVKWEETYLALLERRLNALHPEVKWEVVNTAVPGYNTVMEVATLAEKGLAFHPDIVLLHYVDNDLDLPNFIRKKEDYFALDKSFADDGLADMAEGLMRAPMGGREGHYESDPDKVPEEYKDMVGMAAYTQAMERLKVLSQDAGFEVMVLSHRVLPSFVKAICLRLRFKMVEAGPVWEEYVWVNHVSNPSSAWQVSHGDRHPSPLGHQVIASALVERFEGEGISRRLTQARDLAIEGGGSP